MVRPCFKIKSGMRHASTVQNPPGASLSRNVRLQPPSGLHAHKLFSLFTFVLQDPCTRRHMGAAQAQDVLQANTSKYKNFVASL